MDETTKIELEELKRDIEELKEFSAAHTNAIANLSRDIGALEIFTLKTAICSAFSILCHVAYHLKSDKK